MKNSRQLLTIQSPEMDIVSYINKFNDHTMAVKYCNKIAANFEAVKILRNIGVHLSRIC